MDAEDAEVGEVCGSAPLHPVRCSVNNATSGFSLSCTAIGNAFAVLSDPEKRRRYDQFGDENPQPRIYRDHYDYARGFEGQWNILEISNISFIIIHQMQFRLHAIGVKVSPD